MSRRVRSRIELLYSSRLRRRIVTCPGSATLHSLARALSSHWTIRVRADSPGAGEPDGGICCFERRLAILRRTVMLPRAAFAVRYCDRSSPASASFPEWHPMQYLTIWG